MDLEQSFEQGQAFSFSSSHQQSMLLILLHVPALVNILQMCTRFWSLQGWVLARALEVQMCVQLEEQ
jgi:hypothetical protein